LKFCLTERTYRNPTTTQNFVRIAQGACLPVLHCPAEVMHIDF